MKTKLHAVPDANHRPLSFFIAAGRISDYTGAAALLDDLPKAQWMLADRGYDAAWFRDALEQKGIKPYSGPEISLHARQIRQAPMQTALAASKSCSATSRTGAASRPATIAARRSSPPSALAATVLFWL